MDVDTHVGREDMDRLNPFWRGRPTLVTGATGFLGGCVVRQLLELGANVVCLVKDLVPECELVRTRAVEQVLVAQGDIQDQSLLEGLLANTKLTP